jgi:hypothetical protein
MTTHAALAGLAKADAAQMPMIAGEALRRLLNI